MTDDELAKFTPTERRMLAVLADGQRHARSEFHEPLGMVVVDKGDDGSIDVHIWNMREKLRPLSKWVITERMLGVTYYTMVVLTKPLMPIS